MRKEIKTNYEFKKLTNTTSIIISREALYYFKLELLATSL